MTEREPIHLPLTAKPQNTYSKGGDVFMNNGSAEVIESRPEHIPERVFVRETLHVSQPEYVPPQQLRERLLAFTSEFDGKVAKDPIGNPFKGWTKERLTQEYLGLNAVLAKLEAHELPSNGEELASSTYGYNRSIIAELETRGANMKELFLKVAQEAGEREAPLKSVGAATITDRPADTILQNIVDEINDEIEINGEGEPLDKETIEKLMEAVRRRRDTAGLPAAATNEAKRLLKTLSGFRTETRDAIVEQRRGGDREERIGLYLQEDDRQQLKENPIAWLDKQFDQLYLIARQGQELNSPLVDQIQRLISDALQYVTKKRPEMVNSFSALNTVRFNLMSMRTTIGYSSIENIKKATFTLGAHGLFSGLALENGEVSSMFNRLHEVFEDERLKSKLQHATPEMVHKLQEKVIQEQFDLAKKGQGNFDNLEDIATRIEAALAKKRANEELPPDERVELTDEEKIIAGRAIEVRSKITRSVRTAYDIFVSSQRQAVLVARGKHLTGNDAYFSDPFTGPLNVYNLEDLLIQKFGIYNAEDEEFVRRIKLDLADSNLKEKGKDPSKFSEMEREDLGRRLFRDLFAVPDFFSSGWRIEGVLSSIEERFIARFVDPNASDEVRMQQVNEASNKAENFALFMRLKLVNPAKEPEKRGEIWGKIAKYRPEEIIRLFRERADNELNSLFDNDVFTSANVRNYDELKGKYGLVMRLLREEGFHKVDSEQKFDPDQIDIAELSDNDQIGKIDKILGDGEGRKLIAMFGKMQSFIKDKGLIKKLLEDNRFEDIYTRTLLVDDALLDRLENEENGFVPLSQKFASNQGQDSLVRIWNDTENAVAAGQSLIKFIKTEDGEERMKSALEFAEAVSQYNGQGARANCVRYTVGTFLNLSKQGYFWDVIGLDKLPFRRSMSEIEKIYGPQAKPISRDELRQNLDKIRLFLSENIKEETEEEKAEIQTIKDKKGDIEAWKFTKGLREEKKEKARKAYRDLESILEVTMGDTAKLNIFRALLYCILAGFGEGARTVQASINPKAA